MKETALIDQANDALLKCLHEVPFVKVEVSIASKRLQTGPDFQLQVKTCAGKSTLIVDVKLVGQPRVVREAVNQLARFREQFPDGYGVVMAPYISPQAAEICRDHMVLVGGWIPDLLIPTSQERHVGSIDVDLALNHKEMTEAGYRMIGEILRQHGYTQDQQQPFIFRKDVRGQTVQADFLAGEYGGTAKTRRTQKVLDMQPRKARGCDLAFQIPPAQISVKGKLPDGALDEVKVRIVSVVPFLAMKGIAMEDRRKAIDAYDIYFVLHNYPGGVDDAAELLRREAAALLGDAVPANPQ